MVRFFKLHKLIHNHSTAISELLEILHDEEILLELHTASAKRDKVYEFSKAYLYAYCVIRSNLKHVAEEYSILMKKYPWYHWVFEKRVLKVINDYNALIDMTIELSRNTVKGE